MADTNNISYPPYLSNEGVTTLSKEIFKIIKNDFVTKTEADALKADVAEMKTLFNINPEIRDGNLYISYPDGETAPDVSINSSGEAILNDSGSATDAEIAKMSFTIDADGSLNAEV